MSHWDPNNVKCVNCEEPRLIELTDKSEHASLDERVLWCPACGANLTANIKDPISLSDWGIPRLNELHHKGIGYDRKAGAR